MHSYVASGKDFRSECSLKVEGASDVEAFHAAKRRLPVVTKLERIEDDGTLTTCSGLPFDDLQTEVRSPDDMRLEQGVIAEKKSRMGRLILMLVLVIILGKGMNMCASQMSPPRVNQGDGTPP
jgi:hypothetical protein